MRTRLTRIAAGGALGLTVLAGGAVVVPAVASAAVSPRSDAATEIAGRVTRIQQALAGLVSDGTIDQQQADAVAQRLADGGFGGRGHGHERGHGGRGLFGGLDAAAEALGMTQDELREAVSDGDTLAEVAQQEGVEVSLVVDALVAAAQERLTQAVEDGRLTQAEADERAGDLQERVPALVEQGGPLGRGHHRHGRADSPGQAQTPQPEVQGSATSTRVPRGGSSRSDRSGPTVAVAP